MDNKVDLYNDMARIMVKKIKENNRKGRNTSFILPVGPIGQYKRFARICNLEKISCKNLITINMDKYLDENNRSLSISHPLSFRRFMKDNLFDLLDEKLKVKPGNIFFPNPDNLRETDYLINELDGVDICFGGAGINGHIAFNEPMDEKNISSDEYKRLQTRILNLSRDTIVINSIKYGGYTEYIPKKCIIIGLAQIFKSEELEFYLEHDWQSSVLRKAVFLSPTPEFPVSLLKMHKKSSPTISRNVLKDYIYFK